MLILTRKPGESLYIGDNVKVVIVEVKGSQVRIGIEADKSLRIYREEIYLQILEENKNAAAAAQGPEGELEGLSEAWKDRKEGAGELPSKGGRGLSLGKVSSTLRPGIPGGSGQGGNLRKLAALNSGNDKNLPPQVITRKKKKLDGEDEKE
jgi:carbon storage regulator